ncbi:MAG: hypothetical protein ACD_56C00078G0004 [uncultured bacterium]|nr:MAG: hypothetical protein ACD_56C00078G0004 [uncultured bacterium]
MKRFTFLFAMFLFTLTILSACGGGGGSDSTGTPVSVAKAPDAPTNVTAVAGDGQATITFNLPASDGGSPVTHYIVTTSPGNIGMACSSNQHVATRLTNGVTYQFTVEAVNAIGKSTPSSFSNAVTPHPTDPVVDPAAKWLPDGNAEAITVDENGDYYIGTKKDGQIFVDVFGSDGYLKKEIYVATGANLMINKIVTPVGQDRLIVFATDVLPAHEIKGEIKSFNMTKSGSLFRTTTIHSSSTLWGVSYIEGEDEIVILYTWSSEFYSYLARFDFDGILKAEQFAFNTNWEDELFAMVMTNDMIYCAGRKGNPNGERMPVIFANTRDLTVLGESLQREWAGQSQFKPTDKFNGMTLNKATNTLFLSYQMQQSDYSNKLTLFEVELTEGNWIKNIDVPESVEGGGQFKFLTSTSNGDIYGAYITATGTNQLLKFRDGVFSKVADLKVGVENVIVHNNMAFALYSETARDPRMEVINLSTAKLVPLATRKQPLRRSLSRGWQSPVDLKK